jgi:hypothetical protein
VIDEGVLARAAGGCQVMKAQIERLIEMADLPQVSVRVVAFDSGAHVGVDGPIWVLSLDGRDVAYSGAQNGGRLIETPGEVREMSVMFDRISAEAAPVDASREILKRYLERYS